MGASRLAWGAFAVAVVVLGLKVAAWWATDSTALLADAAESALDIVTSLVLVVVVAEARRPPDREHAWGHGKLEYLSAAVQGVLLTVTALGVGGGALGRLWAGAPVLEVEGGIVWSVAATVLNGLVAAVLIRWGRAAGSPALVADGWHTLSDVGTTLGGWTGLGLAVATGWWVLDPLVALLVTAHIVWVGVGLVVRSSQPLLDGGVDVARQDRVRGRVEEVLAADGDGVLRELRVRAGNPGIFVEATVEVDGTRTVSATHALCDAIEAAVQDADADAETVVHVEPR
jgi:cation diffusion facilitator family transporter